MGNKVKIFLRITIILIAGFLVYVFSNNNEMFYKQPIVQVEGVKLVSSTPTFDEYNNADRQKIQILTGRVINGKYFGKEVTIKNTYSNSGAIDQKYHVGQKMFVDIKETGKSLNAEILSYKRDTYLFMLCFLVIVLLYLTMKVRGIKTILSVAINFVLFLIFVQLDVTLNLTHFFWLFALSAFLFTVLSLMIVIGINKQCLVTLISVISGTSLGILIGWITLNLTSNKGVHYEALELATQSPKQLFFAATLIGVLGAVMDAATDIVSTLFEMYKTNPHISKKQLVSSGKAVGKAIMGPLINVLFLIFFAETIAMAVLYFRTGNSIAYTFEWTMSLGIIQALISGIGIVLVIPTASYLAAYVLKRRS